MKRYNYCPICEDVKSTVFNSDGVEICEFCFVSWHMKQPVFKMTKKEIEIFKANIEKVRNNIQVGE